MNILLGFAPYVAFFLFMRAVSADAGLWAALAVAAGNAGLDWARTGSLKVLEIGTIVLFAGLAVFTWAGHWTWTVMALRLAVDAGLLAIVLASLAIGRPFTLQYARERVPEQYWRAPLFLAINGRITWAWAIALAVMVAAHAMVVFAPAVPVWVDLVVTIIALTAAVRFTTWYPVQARRKAGVPA
jgi:hypothetical protein